MTVKGTLQIDSAAASTLKGDVAIGLLCGVGDDSVIPYEITCEAVGDAADTVKITEEDGTVTVEFN